MTSRYFWLVATAAMIAGSLANAQEELPDEALQVEAE